MAKCGKATEVYSRVTGYHRPIKNWNEGKQSEFKERKNYDLKKGAKHVKRDKSDDSDERDKRPRPQAAVVNPKVAAPAPGGGGTYAIDIGMLQSQE